MCGYDLNDPKHPTYHDRMSSLADERRDPFPLVEETTDPADLPTMEEWLGAGAPMREVGEND